MWESHHPKRQRVWSPPHVAVVCWTRVKCELMLANQKPDIARHETTMSQHEVELRMNCTTQSPTRKVELAPPSTTFYHLVAPTSWFIKGSLWGRTLRWNFRFHVDGGSFHHTDGVDRVFFFCNQMPKKFGFKNTRVGVDRAWDERRRKERTDEPSQLPLWSEEHEPLGKPKKLLAALRCHFSWGRRLFLSVNVMDHLVWLRLNSPGHVKRPEQSGAFLKVESLYSKWS